MNTNRHESETEGAKLILKDEVYQLVGCAMDVRNEIGHELHEKIFKLQTLKARKGAQRLVTQNSCSFVSIRG